MQTYYCERLGKAICVNIPGFFFTFYKVSSLSLLFFRALLSQASADQTQIVTNSSFRRLSIPSQKKRYGFRLDRNRRSTLTSACFHLPNLASVFSFFFILGRLPQIRFLEGKADATSLIPPEQLQKIFGGDVNFEYNHATYFPALTKLCFERKAANLERWRRYGNGKCGLDEAVIKGGRRPEENTTSERREEEEDEGARVPTEGIAAVSIGGGGAGGADKKDEEGGGGSSTSETSPEGTVVDDVIPEAAAAKTTEAPPTTCW